MRNIKIISLYSLLFYVVCASLHASTRPGINFSMHNKTAKEITIWVLNGNRQAWTFVPAGQFVDLPTNTEEKTTIALYATGWNPSGRPSITYQAAHVEIAPGTTVYVNWDGKKIYPQRGPFLGLTGKTDRGYSTENNVKLSSIKLLPPKDPPYAGSPGFPKFNFRLEEILRSR